METTTKQYRLKIVQDSTPSNPFTDWDCEPSLMYEAGRNEGEDYSDGEIDRYLQNYLSDNQLVKHQRKILDLIGISKEEFDLDYPLGEYTKEERRDILRDELDEFISENIENKAAFCETFSITHYSGTSRGYSQGDWADVFIIFTDEDRERLGTDAKHEYEVLEGAFELFGQYAWGDVFGFQVIELCECCGSESDIVDSCYGFYGNNFVENGMMEHIDSELFGGEEKLKEILEDIEVEY